MNNHQPKSVSERHNQSVKNKIEGILQHDINWIKEHPSETIHTLKNHEFSQGKKYNDVTIRNFITFILKSFKDNDGKVPENLNIYYQHYLVAHRDLRQSDIKDKDDVTLLTWQHVLQKNNEFTNNEFGSRRHLVLSVLTLIDPLRNDFNNVTILHRTPNKRILNDMLTNQVIHIILNSRTRKLTIFDAQGNIKTYPISKHLHNVIHASMENHPRQHLIADLEGQPYSLSSYTYFCNSMLKEIFDDDTMNLTKLKEIYVKSL